MNLLKILAIAVIFIIVALFVQSKAQPTTQQKILNVLSEDVAPKIPLYSFVKNNIAAGNLIGVITVVGFSNIPILPGPPVEAYLIFAFSKGTNPILLVLTVSVLTSVTASISYFVGYIFGPKVVEKITKKPFKYSKTMSSLSVPIIFIITLLPLPIPGIFPFIFGAYKSKYRNFIIAVFIANIIRFSVALVLFKVVGDSVFHLPSLIKNIF